MPLKTKPPPSWQLGDGGIGGGNKQLRPAPLKSPRQVLARVPLGVNVKTPYAYVDVVHVWLKRPISNKQRAWLDSQCGKLRTARHLRVTEPAWFDPSYMQTFRLFQPSQEALKWLAERNDVLLTYGELALDYITDDEWSKLALARTFNTHFVQRWHRSRESKIFDNFYGNANTGRRKPGLRFQWYTDDESKVTGEVDCFHVEAKCQGSAALRRIGISHPRDLLSFDHAAFWKRHLVFFQIDHSRLGRYHANKRDGTKRRTPLISRSKRGFVYNLDAAAGHVLWRAFAAHPDEGHFSVQRFVSFRRL